MSARNGWCARRSGAAGCRKRRAPGPAADRPAGPAAPLTPYWKQVYARDPEAPALVLPDYQTALDAAPAPDWQWRPNACAATPCGPGSWSPRRRPASAVFRPVRRARQGPLSERARYWND